MSLHPMFRTILDSLYFTREEIPVKDIKQDLDKMKIQMIRKTNNSRILIEYSFNSREEANSVVKELRSLGENETADFIEKRSKEIYS